MSETPGHIELERNIDTITIGHRHRRDLGDVDALVASIENLGLLQPITITPDGVLVCGRRRLEAVRRLGWRTLKVWVRSGISDELSMLLAQQDENAQHKPLSLIEAETLYREVKQVMAEDARRRQAATRFGAPGKSGQGDGADESSAPRTAGDTRSQASRLVTGQQSFERLERIGWLKQTADNPRLAPQLRTLAAQALGEIDNGAPVASTFLRVKQAVEITAPTLPATPSTADDLERMAKEALARVEDAKHSKRIRALQHKRIPSAYRSVRSFVLTWTELEGWTDLYDIDAIAHDVPPLEWERFERVLAASADFAARVRSVRAGLASSALA